MTIDPASLPIPQLQMLLQSAVAPRPIAFASTVDRDGNINLSPFSFFNMFSSNPPVLVFSPARRATNGTSKHTLDNVLQVPEVAISIVNHRMVEQMSLASTEYEKGVNEFIKSGFTAAQSDDIRPPYVAEAPVSFECTVDQVIALGEGPGAGNLVVARVQRIHLREEYLNEQKQLDTTKLDLVARMGANWYCRASGDALFEIPKPLLTKGIGVDALPESARNSRILTGNNLGRLGNLEQIPSADALSAARALPEVQAALSLSGDESTDQLHRIAQQHLLRGENESALAIVFLG